MPLIVTTKRRLSCSCWGTVGEDESGMCPACHAGGESSSRRAVATLSDAQAFVSGLVGGIMPWPSQPAATRAAADQLWCLPESGGMVGPLPDGTVIEVEAVTYERLGELANEGRDDERQTDWSMGLDIGGSRCHAPILDAFNARETAR